MGILKFYKTPGLKSGQLKNKLTAISGILKSVTEIETELCYYIELNDVLVEREAKILKWILSSPFEQENLRIVSSFYEQNNALIIEIGPRLNFSTAFSSNALSICDSVQLDKVVRIEVSTRYWIKHNEVVDKNLEDAITNLLHDKMTECRYYQPLNSFNHGFLPENWFEVDITNQGRKALEDVNKKLGLAFDDWDLDFYTDLFLHKLKRNPTSVECFDLAQSNSEHSRHWFFKGCMIIDGQEKNESLIDMIMSTQNFSNPNNVIKFSDNSSAIKGYEFKALRPQLTHRCSNFSLEKIKQHLIFTAETHNFPTGVAPFSGATTGTGGRLRDVQGVGRGGYYIAGTAGYSVGNLHIPGYNLPWEDKNVPYPTNMASPLEILVEASNGASDYGNKFGEPVISGFARSFGMTDEDGTRREWIKPIMFSGGLGTVDADMIDKVKPEKGMEVVKIGGPVYRIGVGGGSASSVEVQGDNKVELDFGAVQRGDPEMEQRLNRVVRACTELGPKNPILSIHDQGAGGNGNVLKELVEPAGAVIFTQKFELGDPSISTLELWGAEYQENDAILCRTQDCQLLKQIAHREKCPLNFVGTVTGNGKIILSEEEDCDADKYLAQAEDTSLRHPVDLELEFILGKMPSKTFDLKTESVQRKPLILPENLKVSAALNRVLRLPAVASKRYLTNKVDRCVTGLIAQQQCVGPLHTPLADFAMTAVSHFDYAGIATSIGEQPIKGLVNAAAGARMTVAEALSNLVFAHISDLKDVKCSGNWMWAAKLPGEGAALYEACSAMCSVMKEIGIAIDGGKDSLSMAARIGKDVVKAPGTLVVSTYAPCPDIRQKVTPNLRAPSLLQTGFLLFVDLSNGKSRLGGTALAQVYNQLGDDVPDLENTKTLVNAFCATQTLISEGSILSGHDVSDGGLITCLLEMAFAGISGIDVNIEHKTGSDIEILFAEEVGWILEVDKFKYNRVIELFYSFDVPIYPIGKSTQFGIHSMININVNKRNVLESTVFQLMSVWEETGYQLECRQTNVDCAFHEFFGLRNRNLPRYKLTFNPDFRSQIEHENDVIIRVAVIREEGTNGDREMAAALVKAGFQVWDVTMQDFLDNTINLDHFRGVIFPGGFSYADVLGSAKGWAAGLLYHPAIKKTFKDFFAREDTFSLGVCNGCQLMSLLGLLNLKTRELNDIDVFLDYNISERFECRWSTVKIGASPSIMLKGMEGSVLGIWVAHGEGRFTFRNKMILSKLKEARCIALNYTDEYGNPTTIYPLNPNGTIEGIAGICSSNGRHLAMMPHPERCVEVWQWPWRPEDWKFVNSPWQRMFDNAYAWCTSSCTSA
ncbi:phosphoribosylformylglycinamidine synthase isoform X2 [Prorops nasuta]|uniref:phosphoribosylformylglycinamidine synthase isoform X2 n=1 Tax=Prorops nasuta TaxID=863751 RepID=UPI0034CD5F97